MSTIGRFQNRINALPSYLQLRSGYRVIEEQAGQYLLLSATNSFKITLPFPNIPLIKFLEQLTGQQTITILLEPLPPFHVNFLLDIVETLYQADLLLPASSNGHHPRYSATALLFDQLQQARPTREKSLEFLTGGRWQTKLATARVGVLGLGRVGSQLTRLLAIAGVGHIVGVDAGLVDDDLCYTDAWYSPAEQGKPRQMALQQKLSQLNDACQFTPLATSLDEFEKGVFPPELYDLDLIVVATDDPRPQLYDQINTLCVQAGSVWTSYRSDWTGLQIEIGPTVHPKETACYACYQHRWRSNLAQLERDEVLLAALQKQTLPLVDLQITPCVSLLCYEILRFLSAEIQPYTLGAILKFDIVTAELTRHPLLKVPQCPTCRRNIQPFAPVRFWSEIAEAVTPAPERLPV